MEEIEQEVKTLRQRILNGEEIPSGEYAKLIASIRDGRAGAATARKKAEPTTIDVDSLLNDLVG